jgi:hypothetical protein
MHFVPMLIIGCRAFAGPIAGHVMSTERTIQPNELRAQMDEALESFSVDEIRQLIAEIEWELATRSQTACGLFMSNARGAAQPIAANDD